MGQAVELLTGFTTAPGATFTALTPSVGNTFTIRSADPASQVCMLGAWAFNQAAGTLRVRSPRLHDNQQGVRMRIGANQPGPKYPMHRFMQRLIPQDVLTVELTGSATAGQIELASLLVYYADLPGIAGRFVNPDQVARWGVNCMGQDLAVTPGITGGYSGQAAINTEAGCDQWKANTDYALLGYNLDTACCSVRIQGADSGNLGVGGPGFVGDSFVTEDWFAKLSDLFMLSLIPVFNAANKNAILVDIATNQTGAAVNLSFNFIELRPPSART